MSEFTSTSGAQVKINPADFMDAIELQSAIADRISMSPIKMSFKSGVAIEEQDIDAAEFVKLAAGVIADKSVRDALFKCLGKCTHNGQRITPSTFNDITARQDFYEVAIACVKENIGHFIAPLLSKFFPALAVMLERKQG